jgi:poly(3-hydroxybutyrate) depolymerase
MLYHAYELTHAMLYPWHQLASYGELVFNHPCNLLARTPWGRSIGASCSLFKNLTSRFGKPEFGIEQTSIFGLPVPVEEQVLLSKPFCDLLHFDRDENICGKRYDPKVLIVAPMSGHFATLLRGTVKAMIPEHNTYITDWKDARTVPLLMGKFDLDEYIDYIIEFIRYVGANTHVIAVCQPSVAVLAATAIMAEQHDPCTPLSLTLMGGPIDPRRNPTAVNEHAHAHDINWFRRNVITQVPFPHMGMMRQVYPGFLQLSGFMSMNLDRHIDAFHDYFNNMVKGDADSVRQHETFYNEYLAVMDLSAEFFLQTIERVFQRYDLANGTFMYRGRPVNCAAIKDISLMTVEGEKDDICAVGQTEAAHDLCPSVPDERRYHYVQPGVGHYGVFNGTRWRTEIQPRIREMIRTTEFRLRTGTFPRRKVA